MNERGSRKTLTGVVVSNKMDKTAIVAVERRHRHRIYRKIIRTTARYKAHDANNQAKIGDTVKIVETRPLSKDKRWRIDETMTVGNVADLAPRDIGAPVTEEMAKAAASQATKVAEPAAPEMPTPGQEQQTADQPEKAIADDAPVVESSGDVSPEAAGADDAAEASEPDGTESGT